MGPEPLHIKYIRQRLAAVQRNDMNVREPAVAGMFYAGRAEQLRRDVESLLGSGSAPPGKAPKAIIVPHAGYVYSGPIAAAAYRLLAPARNDIHRVALFGPAHRVYLDGMAVPAANAFATPLGTVRLDREALDDIAGLPDVGVSDAAHRDEHSLEVQLPFLQTVLADFTLVPVVVGKCAPERVAAAIDALWGGAETLVVISSDLSHYLPYEQATEVDANTCARILGKSTTLTGHEACGAQAINGLMRARHCEGLNVAAMDVRNSGDTAGDRSRVVGYGSFVLH